MKVNQEGSIVIFEDELNIQDVLHGAYRDHPHIKTLGIRRSTDYSDVFRLIGVSISITILLIV